MRVDSYVSPGGLSVEGLTVRDKLLQASKNKTDKRLADVLTHDQLVAFSLQDRLPGRKQTSPEMVTGSLSRSKTTLNILTPRRLLLRPQHDAIELAPKERLIDVFRQEDMAGRLLILGESGSGRTTALLELARDLLTVAETNDQAPVPLIFELSSWMDERQSIEQWLVDQLWGDYNLPSQQGQQLMATHQILPLLDGLDELGSVRQETCIALLNQLWPEDEPDRQGVVCGYSREMDLAGGKLTKLNRAVELQPLSAAQIQAYLAEMVCPDVWATIQASPELRQLASKPLMLTLMPVALANRPAQTQKELFAAYIQARFDGYEQERGKLPYSREQTLRYLGWLARKLRTQNQTVLLIEGMQPTWVGNATRQWAYRWMVGLMVGLIVGLLTGLVFGRIIEPLVGWMVGLLAGLIFGLLYGMLIGLIFGPLAGLYRVSPVERFKFSLSDFSADIVSQSIHRGRVVGQFIGRALGVFLGLIVLLLFLLLAGPLLGLIFGLVFGLLSIWFLGLIIGLIIGPIIGLTVGSMIGLIVSLRPDVATCSQPNQGIWISAQNVLISVVLGLGFAALLYASLGWLLPLVGVEAGWVNVIAGGAIAITLILCILIGGGLACIQHFALRWVLWRRGLIPWDYAHFLRHATDLRLMRQTGGEFRFFHHLLQEHMAADVF